jgi:hypothetical protein
MRYKRPANLLILSMITASYPCLTGLATCSPIAPPPLPVPRSLEKADQNDVVVSAFGGGGAAVFDKEGGGGGLDVEYRPEPTVGITGDLLVGGGGAGGNLPNQTLVQYGLGVNYYFFPTKKLKFYPLLVEFRMDMSHLGNHSFTMSPSAGLTAGFYFWHIEFSASTRIGLGLPVVEGEAVMVASDSDDVSMILQTFYFEADANLWVHFGRFAIGVFFRYLQAHPNWGSPKECRECEDSDHYLGGGGSARVRF